MSYLFKTRLGEQLYQLLPEVYRTRDKLSGQAGGQAGSVDDGEDLAKYLDAHGHLLDLIHATLQQQLEDSLPESSQDWLLPYFAQLLAANLVSPEAEGRHAEIDHAISWRQRKGTLKCAEQIAEAVGQMEVEIQEGWKRVAMTPRVGLPIIPPKALNASLEIDMAIPSDAARHPGLPAVMVDLRHASRAVDATPDNPAAHVSNFAGIKQTWRQMNVHGAPCFPGSFDDVSRRTVDIRTPDSRNGHHHHKRLLAYAPPPAGLFVFEPLAMTWQQALQEKIIELKQASDVFVYSNNTSRTLVVYGVSINDANDTITLDPGKNYRIENINFSGTLLLGDGQLELRQVEASKVKVDSFSTDMPVLTASDCLLNDLSVGAGTARLDSCTVLQKAILKDMDAVSCIFGEFAYNAGVAVTGKAQYCRVPLSLYEHIQDSRLLDHCVTTNPKMFATGILYAGDAKLQNGAGVLRPDCDSSIYAGAGDAGEMGYFHHGRKGRPVTISTDIAISLPEKAAYALTDLIFSNGVVVTAGTLELERSAIKSLTINSPLPALTNKNISPALLAIDCLFDTLTVADNLARLEYCTVMQAADCKFLQASDCIFAGTVSNVENPASYVDPPPFLNCIRYSSIPAGLTDDVAKALRIKDSSNRLRLSSNTMQTPVFIQFEYCHSAQPELRIFGEPGYGVLSITTPDDIRFGAEDSGEMGACHHKYYSLKWEAVLDKMREFLPVGIEPVLIQDARLLQTPPAQQI